MILKAAVLLTTLALPAAAQEEGLPPIPPFHRAEAPNGAFQAELEAAAAALGPEQRRPFFNALRRRERDLAQVILDTEQTLRDARALQKSLESKGAPTVGKARGVVASEEERLRAYRAMAKAIQALRRRLDPQRIDASDLRVDLYGGFQFSSLYRDPGKDTSFFSKSRPFASLDIRQTFHRPDRDSWLETFSTLSFQSSSYEQSEALNIITSSGQFRAEAGAWWMKSLTESVSWGVVGSLGLVGYSQSTTENGLESNDRDAFRNRVRLGLTLRQESGPLKGSFAEWSYLRDPLFQKRDRLFVRGRVVLTQLGSEGASGDFYMEGSVNKAGAGRDEAVLLVGLRLSTLAFLRSLGAGGR